MNRFLTLTLAGALLAVTAQSANATMIDFAISSATATQYGIATDSTIVTATSLVDGKTFSLADTVGATTTFDFLNVSVTGLGGAAGLIDATINFASPVVDSVNGVLGGFAVNLGFGSLGALTVLSDPGPIAFNGGTFDVDFLGFPPTLCIGCTSLSGIVQAKVTVTSVPEPGTISLLGAGLLALAFAGRRRRLTPKLI